MASYARKGKETDMNKWVTVTSTDDGFVVLTGYDDKPSSTFRFNNVEEALNVARKYLAPPEIISIFVSEKIGSKERIG